MRKKRRAIILISFILVMTVIALVLCFVPMKFGNTTWEGFASNIKLGTDLKGGVYAVYEVSDDESRVNLDERLDSTVTRLLNMIQDKGYPEATVVREGNTRVRVEVPDVENPEALFRLIGEPASMKFRIYETADDNAQLLEELSITGKNIKSASASYQDAKYGVSIEFDNIGREVFSDVTSRYLNKYMRILVNTEGASDENAWQTLTTAQLSTRILDGKTFISGSFTQESSESLAQQILAGAFAVKLKLQQSDVMSASLGVDALKYSLIAGLIAVAFIIVFLCAVYRGMGLVSGIALMIYAALFIFLLWSFPWVQLSLPGIAGIILSLGMAVDANVIIFERIREEYALGKSIKSSVSAGFKRSMLTVLDANITTILASVVLIIVGTGTVQGFGITLLMGILLSLLTSLAISRGLFKLFLNINKNNAKFYGLKRDETVVEIPDEDDSGKKKEDDAISFEMIQQRDRLTGGKK